MKRICSGTWMIPVALFALLFFAYRQPPLALPMDSHYSMLLSENLLKHGTFQLDRYFQLPVSPYKYPGMDAINNTNYPYHVYVYQDHFYYLYPPGSAVLCVPFVAMLNARGISAATDEERYSIWGEIRMERWIAPFVTALACVFIFLSARAFLGVAPSLFVTLAFAFGTSLWSTTSRVMWTHTWGVCLLALAIWLLVRSEVEGKRLPRIFFATVLAWLCCVRPTYAITVGCVCAYLLFFRRRDFWFVVPVGVAWLAALVVYSLTVSGSAVLPYWKIGATLYNVVALEGVLGVLVSPSRGLLIYSPFVLVAAWLPCRYRPQGAALRLAWLAGAASLLHLVIVGVNSTWQGGHCYGPRYTVDFLPWLALLLTIG
ncbi:MAG TPA: hypothetical protein VIH35_09690, partial [Kiritimatiellia bacterium]